MSAATQTAAPAGSAAGRSTRSEWRTLVVQIAAIAACFAAFAIWLAVAPLSATERQTLNPGSIWNLTLQHLALTFVGAAIVLVIAVPLGIVLTRGPLRKAAGPILAIANFGQSAPAIGLIALLAIAIPSGFWSAITALVLYAALPVLRNTMIGIQGVDGRLVEAGRGMGMSAAAVLFRVELPLAVPVMLSGVRTALVLLVGTAALAAFINGGGLGLLIVTGVNLFIFSVLVAGAVLTALLALLIDWMGRVVEQIFRPKGI
jgi:osmoprotectant transport system permease protein